ncbi:MULTISPECIES: hypothetical protein [unclassified Bradyrhizobium]|uniref:ATP-dependent DNA ligase n=1 Tax=unclassified Bradyrhizobium TaxID=2631580 RepID=UPI001FF9B739|nr:MULTISPECIES: hypothetical protein [unclassified Bradyrhizobium]
MLKAFEFCLPTAAKAVPVGPDWIHEIKYDGYRLRVERQGKSVRLITKNGHNWTARFSWIVQAALKNREQQFVIDGEAVVLGVDGVSDWRLVPATCSRYRQIDRRPVPFFGAQCGGRLTVTYLPFSAVSERAKCCDYLRYGTGPCSKLLASPRRL